MSLLPVADALKRVLDAAKTLRSERIGLRQAFGRTMAEPITAQIDNPPFDASAMDGYAVRSADIATPPATLTLIGESGAGRPFTGALQEGTCVRIFTGAPIPSGADAVVIQEDTSASGSAITLGDALNAGANIRPRGQDFARGALLIDRGKRLTARDLLLAAAGGYATLPVVRKPIVAVLSTGDELVEPGSPLAHGQIWASNAFGLAAMIEAAGGEARLLGVARDSLDSLSSAISAANDADILLTIGGASVGDRDLVRPALEKSGARLDFYKIAMRPGKPLFFGSRVAGGSEQHCLGFPGNPVSALICARVFLVPLIGRLLGREVPFETTEAVLAEPIGANGPREHYMRALLDTRSSPPRVTPFANQDSGSISALQRANCLVTVAANAPAQPAGSAIEVLTLDI